MAYLGYTGYGQYDLYLIPGRVGLQKIVSEVNGDIYNVRVQCYNRDSYNATTVGAGIYTTDGNGTYLAHGTTSIVKDSGRIVATIPVEFSMIAGVEYYLGVWCNKENGVSIRAISDGSGAGHSAYSGGTNGTGIDLVYPFERVNDWDCCIYCNYTPTIGILGQLSYNSGVSMFTGGLVNGTMGVCITEAAPITFLVEQVYAYVKRTRNYNYKYPDDSRIIITDINGNTITNGVSDVLDDGSQWDYEVYDWREYIFPLPVYLEAGQRYYFLATTRYNAMNAGALYTAGGTSGGRRKADGTFDVPGDPWSDHTDFGGPDKQRQASIYVTYDLSPSGVIKMEGITPGKLETVPWVEVERVEDIDKG